MTTILDLPVEILESIFHLLRPDLDQLVCLSSVCVLFRRVSSRVPVRTVHVPLSDRCLAVLASRGFPVSALCCREPAMFVAYQFRQMNLRRLETAELVGNNYLTGKNQLSPHYVGVLEMVAAQASSSLRHLVVNLDLLRDGLGEFRCLRIASTFKNLTFLSIAFTQGIELEQKVTKRLDGQALVKRVVETLPKLKSLYIFCCPTDKLVIHSETLQKLHIYKSEFAAISDLKTPRLRKLMFHNSLSEFFSKMESNRGDVREADDGGGVLGEARELFSILYEDCPALESFNGVNLGCLRGQGLTKPEWCYYALALCFKKSRSLHTSH